jgi:diguanylate cyclase (GGDEF)-like protein
MGLPLIGANEVMGALTLDRYDVEAFQPDEIELAQAFANQASAAVQNARLYQATKQRARELEALHSATKTLVSTLDLQKLLEHILAAAGSAIPSAETTALHLLDENQNLTLSVKQSIELDHVNCLECTIGVSPWAWVMENHSSLLISRKEILPEAINAPDLCDCWNNRSLMAAPLLLEDKLLGTITVISSIEGIFSEQDMFLLNSFANTATAAIHNAQLHSAVQYLAVTDPLTGLYNRRGFFDLASQLIEQSLLHELPTAAIMIDIDFFKRINDSYGHDAGDAVLRTLAERCREALRESDLICRYGGEEFAILLAESDIVCAQSTASRLFHKITDLPMETPTGLVFVTISVGMAAFDMQCDTIDKLLKRADQALYLAKERGRNQVCVWNG